MTERVFLPLAGAEEACCDALTAFLSRCAGLPLAVVPEPARVASARRELDVLTEAVGDLPEKCRTVFLLYRGEGLSMREIAARLGIAEDTVETCIARAMLHCRRQMRREKGQS